MWVTLYLYFIILGCGCLPVITLFYQINYEKKKPHRSGAFELGLVECSEFELSWILFPDEVDVATSGRKLEELLEPLLLVIGDNVVIEEEDLQFFFREVVEVDFLVGEISESVAIAETAPETYHLVVSLFFRSECACTERQRDGDDSKNTSEDCIHRETSKVVRMSRNRAIQAYFNYIT